ncbi:MAG: hypothetical protein RL196_740 [Actinomycetota bacterium]|jgi:hypothetical protein
MNEFLIGAWDVLLALTPPILVGAIFWVVMRSIIRSDRTERKVYAKIEAEEIAKFEAAKAARQAAQKPSAGSAAQAKASESKN